MTDFTQHYREIQFRTGAIPSDVIAFEAMRGRERLGRPFKFEVIFSCLNHTVAARDILDKAATVALATPYGERQFNGIVTSFDIVDQGQIDGKFGEWIRYRVELRPRLWRLAYSSHCRFFYNKTVLQIAEELLKECGIDPRMECSKDYVELSHCAQYRESDLDFLNRLLQREGLYYYFEHRDGVDEVVLADGTVSAPALEHYASIPFDSLKGAGHVGREAVYRWKFRAGVSTKTSRTNAYDFRNVDASSKGQLIEPDSDPEQSNGYVVDDYATRYAEIGNIVDLDENDYRKGSANRRRLAKVGWEAREAAAAVARGRTNVPAMLPGATFELDHPHPDQKGKYLIVEARYKLLMDAGGVDDNGVFDCRFKAIPVRHKFRSPPWTLIPRAGLQTAKVVTPRDDPYAADKHGRIKVQFHWETFNPSGADPSQRTWVRVAQGWAGRNWGAMFLPRAGQEVIVAFLDGDPDYPIVVGSLYNNVNAPPYELPAHGAISTLRSASVNKGSDERNELRFNDDKTQMLFYTDGRSDNYIGTDQRTWVGGNANFKVVGEQRVKVKEQHLTVSGNQNSAIDGNAWTKVQKNMVCHAGESVLIKGDVSVVIESDVGISLKCGESFVSLNPGGLRISSPLTQIDGELVRVTGEEIMLNCAGAASMGAGKSPPGPPSGPNKPDPDDNGKEELNKIP